MPLDGLEGVRAALAACEAQGITLASSLSDLRWSQQPAPGEWSPAECLEHLNATAHAMLPLLRDGAREARDRQWTTGKPLRAGLVASILSWYLEPPYRIKTKAPRVLAPADGRTPKADVMNAWKEEHAALGQLIIASAGLALDRPKITSPFNAKGRLRYSVYGTLLILAAHERRHLWQASRAAGIS